MGGPEDYLEDIGDRFVEFQMPDEDSGRDSAYEEEDFDSDYELDANEDFRRLYLEPNGETGDRVTVSRTKVILKVQSMGFTQG